jgi:ketosteroid isomerase-like protein
MKTNTINPENTNRSDIKSVVLNHLERSTQDFSSWLDLLHDDIVIEFPYGESAGNPPRLKGKAVIAETITAFFNRVPEIRFNNPTVYLCVDPDEAFATYEVEVKVPDNGRIYKQKYIGHFRQSEGKLVYLSEYYDPTKTISAFGP